MGLVKNKRFSTAEKIAELRKLFNMSNLSFLTTFNDSVSYRNTQEFPEKSIVNSNIMLEIPTNFARNVTETKFNKRLLERKLTEVRKITLEDSRVFYPRLEELLLECGIILIGLPKLKNANLQEATKRFHNGSVLLLITDRNKSSGIFWFSLLHEIGHILFGDYRSELNDMESYAEKETKADSFSQNFFIPNEVYKDFIVNNNLSEHSILQFANELETHHSIVIGRLQNENLLEHYQFNNHKAQYSFSFSN